MEVLFLHPIDFCIGKLGKQSEFYCRKSKYGKVFMQHCPRRKSEKQIAWYQEFAKRYAGQNRMTASKNNQIRAPTAGFTNEE